MLFNKVYVPPFLRSLYCIWLHTSTCCSNVHVRDVIWHQTISWSRPLTCAHSSEEETEFSSREFRPGQLSLGYPPDREAEGQRLERALAFTEDAAGTLFQSISANESDTHHFWGLKLFLGRGRPCRSDAPPYTAVDWRLRPRTGCVASFSSPLTAKVALSRKNAAKSI